MNKPNGRLRVEFTVDTDTPCMVYCGMESSTFECALQTGTVGDNITLTTVELHWLDSLAEQADEWYNKYRNPNI